MRNLHSNFSRKESSSKVIKSTKMKRVFVKFKAKKSCFCNYMQAYPYSLGDISLCWNFPTLNLNLFERCGTSNHKYTKVEWTCYLDRRSYLFHYTLEGLWFVVDRLHTNWYCGTLASHTLTFLAYKYFDPLWRMY